MASVLDASIAAILGLIGIIIFANVYAAMNTSMLSAAVIGLLGLVTLILSSVLIIRIVIGGFQ